MQKFLPSLSLIILKIISLVHGQQHGCTINVAELQDPQPMVLALNFQTLYPSIDNDYSDTSILVSQGERITISCVTSEFANDNLNATTTIVVTCNSNFTLISDEGVTVEFSELQCKQEITTAVQSTRETCMGDDFDSELINIGFDVRKDNQFYQFVNLVSVCLDKFYRRIYYATYQISKSIGFKKAESSATLIEDSDLYKLNVTLEDLYSQENSVRTVNKLVGLPLDSTQYISKSFTRSNLVDFSRNFVYNYQIREAARFLNIFPQWPLQDDQISNWDALNQDITNYVTVNKLDLVIYVGSWGVAKLPHEDTGSFVEIYLAVDEGFNVAIPIPVGTWKVLYDAQAKTAIVFLSVNPKSELINENLVICNDISGVVTWLTWKAQDETLGYSYACSYHQLREVIVGLPRLDVVGNLL